MNMLITRVLWALKTAPALAVGLFTLVFACVMTTTPASYGAITIETMQIGSPENVADTVEQWDETNGYGAVGYTYAIGTTEVTVEQYTAFLNAVAASDPYGLYNATMADVGTQWNWGCGIVRSEVAGSYTYAALDGYADRPVNYVSFWDAARFCNWLTNGQPTGAAATAAALNTGVYNFPTGSGDGYAGGYAINPANNSVTRNTDAWNAGGWALPSEDEWYKAAYYNVGDGTYTTYATGGTITNSQANYYNDSVDGANWSFNAEDLGVAYRDANGNLLSPTGHYDEEQNGTFDMMGNVWEWNDTTIENNYRGLRGGSFGLGGLLASSARGLDPPGGEDYGCGFRVSSLAVPEPSTYGLMGGAVLLGMMMLRRRKNRVTL